MGCGQSKINLYPRRNKNGGKGNSAKKSGGGSKESDDEEGNTGTAKPDDADDDAAEKNKMLPLLAHAHTIEVSESQQDFFKMLDDRIEQGRDYDSSSDTEIRIEQERRKLLLEQWPTPSQPTCPSTPVRRRVVFNQADRQSSPGAGRRCCRQLPDGASPPPPRRAHTTPPNHSNQLYSPDWLREEVNKSPNRRLNTTPPWKNQSNPCNHKPKRNDINENQRIYKTEIESSHGSSSCSNHSPTHAANSKQPYIAQIIAHPAQPLSPPATPKLIAPPEEYQDPHTDHEPDNIYEASQQTNQPSPQPPIYFIHSTSNQNLAQDLQQQRQQTAFHLRQYVAMKQAQQHVYTYIERGPHAVFPGVEYSQIDPSKAHEYEEYYSNTTVTALRPHSAPTSMGPVRAVPVLPGYGGVVVDRAHLPPAQLWTPMPAVVSSMGPWVPGQSSQDLAYYPQSQYLNMYRPNSAGSAGTLTRYKDKKVDNAKDNVCQINLVRQKPVGQIVTGGQELAVCSASSSSPSPASVSTDSGVSPGNNGHKNTDFTPPPPSISHKDTHNHVPSTTVLQRPSTTVETKNKKNKITFGRSLKNSKSLDSS